MGTNSIVKTKPIIDMYIIMDYKYCKVWINKINKI